MVKINAWFPTTLRAKFILLLVVMFAFFIGFEAIESSRDFEKIKNNQIVELQWASRWIESEQSRHFALARMIAYKATSDIRKGLTAKVCRQGYVGELSIDSELGHFAIAEPNGNISCNSIPWLTAKNVADQEYFKQAMKLVDQDVVSEADSKTPGQYTVIKARAMHDKDGHVLKVVLVAMDFSWIKEEEIHLPAAGHLLLVNAKGVVLGSSQNVADWVNKSIANSPFYKNILTKTDSAFEGLGNSGANSWIVSHSFSTGAGIMRVIIEVPSDAILGPAYLNLVVMLLISVVSFILILFLIYRWSNKVFLSRMLAIDLAAKKLTNGDLAVRVNMSDCDELGHLAKSFDTMANSLQLKAAEVLAVNDELYRANRALHVLSAGNKSLLFAKTEQELLERICHDIVEAGDYLAAWIGFSEATNDHYLHTAATYSKSEDSSNQIDWNEAGNGLQPVITAIRADQPLVINDTHQESVHHHLAAKAIKFGYQSVVILPLHFEAKPFGALILCAYRKNEFGDNQIEFLKETAADVSFGIEMLRTKGDRNRLALMEKHHEDILREGLEDALNAIAMTIEMRDPYTSGHEKRVAALAKAIATELGMNAEEIHSVYLASIVHDIGKIKIPAEILVKPSRLSNMEFELVKQHAAAGYEILKNIRFPWPIADMVHQHHERMDGSGYPLGLKGGEILFRSRILAVADVVEAMSSHRPYRPGLGEVAALDEIKNGRGTHYDEVVVDVCLKLFGEGRFKF